MRVGIVSRTATYEPFYRLGDTVELVELGSTAAGVDALLTRRVDVAATCPDVLIASEAPLRIGAGLVARPPTSMVARGGIHAVAELRGRRIGTTAPEGSVSIFLRAALRAHGLARGDYTEVVIGPTPAQAAGLESGEIDAAMLTAPFDAQLAARGFRVLADVGALLGPCAFTTLNVRAGWTATDDWRAFVDVVASEIARSQGLIAYDLRLDLVSLQRLMDFMRDDRIKFTRRAADLVDGQSRRERAPI